MPLDRGTKLGPYQIESPIGAGGMGEVYKATDTRLERTVAIKVLPAHVASDPDLKQRFEREAKTISSLNHPHIYTLYDVGQAVPGSPKGLRYDTSDVAQGFSPADEIQFLVMEYLEGETLAQRLTKGALPLKLDQALRYAIEIADALDKAHRQGVTHRDLKPGNIFLHESRGPTPAPSRSATDAPPAGRRRSGHRAVAKLLDFGLAKLKPTGPQSDASTKLAESLTQQGMILGTFQYMAPEQLEGQDADTRTDIFAFGAVVYEMATGKKAFTGKSQASLISAIMTADPPAMSSLEPLMPAGLDYVVKTCLCKEPDDRWQTARDLLRELKRVEGSSAPASAVTPAIPATTPARFAQRDTARIGDLGAGSSREWSCRVGADTRDTASDPHEHRASSGSGVGRLSLVAAGALSGRHTARVCGEDRSELATLPAGARSIRRAPDSGDRRSPLAVLFTRRPMGGVLHQRRVEEGVACGRHPPEDCRRLHRQPRSRLGTGRLHRLRG